MLNSFIPTPVLYSLLYTLAFVLALYFKNGRRHRNHPEAVKQRFISVSVVCILVMLHISTLIHKPNYPVFNISAYEFHKTFIRIDHLAESILIPTLLTLILYSGPLVDAICNGYIGNILDSNFGQEFSINWIAARNLIVAPLAEELVFRAAIMFHMQSLFRSCEALCVVSALFFSIAHFHHVYGEMIHGERFHRAFMKAVFQVCYTTLFGIYSGFLMLRTGNVLSAVFAHSLCNFMGLPDPFGAIERGRLRWGIGGQLLAVVSHVAGLALWINYLYTATNPSWFGNRLSRCYWL